MTYRSSSSAETKRLASELAKKILSAGAGKKAAVLALHGELGAGKTTFVQGFFKGLGLQRSPASPTFIFMRRTGLRKKGFKNVFHVDAYRARHPEDLNVLGLPEIFKNPENIVLIEWPERLKKLPPGTRKLEFRHGRHADERVIRL